MTVFNDHLLWKIIEDYPNYEVSNAGTVRNRKSKKLLSLNTKKGKHPYQRAHLSRDGKTAYVLVHRLVLQAFVGPCPPGQQCLHKDSNPRNNHLSNLKWGTVVENHSTIDRSGERNGRCKLQASDIPLIRTSPLRHSDLARHYGVSDVTIANIRNRKLWSHIG